jgi:hypothetical protein
MCHRMTCKIAQEKSLIKSQNQNIMPIVWNVSLKKDGK